MGSRNGREKKLKADKKSFNVGRTWRLLWRFIRPWQLLFLGSIFLVVVSAALILGMGYGLRHLVDEGFSSRDTRLLDQSFYFLLVCSFLLSVAAFSRTAITSWLAERVTESIRLSLFRHFLSFDRYIFDRQRVGDLLGMLHDDAAQVTALIGKTGALAARSMIQLFGGTVLLLFTSPKLTGMVFLIVPVVLIPIRILGRDVRELSRKSREIQGQLQSDTEEILGALAETQLYQNEGHAYQKFRKGLEENWHVLRRRLFMRSSLIGVVIFLAFSAISSVILAGGHDVMNGNLTPGALSSFVFYAIVVAGSMNQVAELLTDFQSASGSLDRIGEAFDLRSTIIVQEGVARDHFSFHKIVFDNVTFAYPARLKEPALRDISLTLDKGSKVAIVGPSGAGKSTIFQLLTRLYDPQEGRILVDGQDIRSIPLADLRGLFSVVPQDPAIFNDTIYQNIAFGYPHAPERNVFEAAREACVEEFVLDLPQQYETLTGERGVRLSGGQKQRIAIARALLRPAPVLLMDEATNALDATNESLIQKALERLMKDRTVLVIAHRLSTVMTADMILVMDKGRIVQVGNHASLISCPGLYRSLAEKQFFTGKLPEYL